MSFDWKSAIAARPAGDTKAALVAFYGDPLMGATRTGGGKFEPSKAFVQTRMTFIPASELPNFPPYGEQRVAGITLNRAIAPWFVATWAELHRRDLTSRLHVYSGATVYRHMLWSYSNPVSLHAYGAAVDFDAGMNGYGLPPAKMQIDRDVVRCFEECGAHWGGRWNPTDGMHFQFTDPLPNVAVPEWQDAMAKRTVQIVKPEIAQPLKPALLIPDNKGGWVNVAGRKVEGQFSVINAENPMKIWAR